MFLVEQMTKNNIGKAAPAALFFLSFCFTVDFCLLRNELKFLIPYFQLIFKLKFIKKTHNLCKKIFLCLKKMLSIVAAVSLHLYSMCSMC